MLCYGDVDEEEGDMFFDSLDFIPTSPGSASSEDSVNEATDLAFPEFCYNIWREKPISVRERREKFFREMGFGEFAHSSSQLHCDDDEEVKSLTSSEFERITNSSNPVSTSSSPPSNGLTKNSSFGRIRDLGYQPNNVFGNVGAEAASIKQRTAQEVKFSTEKEDWDRVTGNGSKKKKNGFHWWKRLIERHKEETQKHKRNVLCNGLSPKARRMRVRNHKKSSVEFTAVYMEQEIQAHKGFIWTMKFSPDGKFLATGGEDGIVRIWRVGEAAGASCKYLDAENISWSEYGVDRIKEVESICEKQKPHSASVVVVPDKVFRIEETPLHEFRGHTSDVLDLSWSKSKCLLSSSEDKTVRLWEVGCETCLKVFHHSDYVTCVQFNPADDRYFISGSIDGNIRIWGVLENRVVDWAKVHDIITAVRYRPDGQGCIVGSVAGNCCFYDASGNHLQLDAQLRVQGKKKPTGTITGFQFFPEDPHRVMITSADSKVWILDGLDVIHKYKGLRKSGNQMSASFTSNGKHIISVGEDSRVYIWNYNALGVPSSKRAKSIRSCEHFFSEGVLVAIPWLGMEPEKKGLGEGSLCCSTQQLQHLEATISWPRDPDRFSLGSWFFSDSLSRSSATWPEEKLPLHTPPVSEDGDDQLLNYVHHYEHNISLPATWGTVIVTAGLDGMIRSFHNYGLPSRR